VAHLEDVSSRSQAPGTGGVQALPCDRAIFTSLPSPTGEGYRLVAWSTGLRPEERQELTRRAPSHGALAGEAEAPRGTVLFRLQSTGRFVYGLVRVSGAEHTRRGGGRVWTDFFLADAFAAAKSGLLPADFRAALAAAGPPKQPVGNSPLPRVDVVPSAPGAGAQRSGDAAAALASMLYAGKSGVVAVGAAPHDVFEDALRMLPAAARGGIEAAGGLRFSPARGVKLTVIDKVDQDLDRATRGHGIERADFTTRIPALDGPLAPWFALMARWWKEGRASDATGLASRMGDGWTSEDILGVAALCEAIDRGEARPDALAARLAQRPAA
jgi:hypothetical protein